MPSRSLGRKARLVATFLALPQGFRRTDTFGRVFARLDPEAFERCFVNWVRTVSEVTAGQVIAIDGKCLRRSHDKRLGKEAIHMVSAWATESHLVLGQRKVDTKSNEITAIPALLELLAVSGCIVTIDAMGCQKAIAQQIIEQHGDYVLALKENHPHLYEDVESLFHWADNLAFEEIVHDTCRVANKGHGRLEVRECWTISDPKCSAMLGEAAAWSGLRTVIRVRAERHTDTEVTCETRYYLSSLAADTPDLAATALAATRRHWGIENELHWVLDIAFREDDCRIRQATQRKHGCATPHRAELAQTREVTQDRHQETDACWRMEQRLSQKVLSH